MPSHSEVMAKLPSSWMIFSKKQLQIASRSSSFFRPFLKQLQRSVSWLDHNSLWWNPTTYQTLQILHQLHQMSVICSQTSPRRACLICFGCIWPRAGAPRDGIIIRALLHVFPMDGIRMETIKSCASDQCPKQEKIRTKIALSVSRMLGTPNKRCWNDKSCWESCGSDCHLLQHKKLNLHHAMPRAAMTFWNSRTRLDHRRTPVLRLLVESIRIRNSSNRISTLCVAAKETSIAGCVL